MEDRGSKIEIAIPDLPSSIFGPTPTLTRFWRDPYNSPFPDDPPQEALSLPTLIDPAPL
jgi:hypothetical protein